MALFIPIEDAFHDVLGQQALSNHDLQQIFSALHTMLMNMKAPLRDRIIADFAQDEHDVLLDELCIIFDRQESVPYFEAILLFSYFFWNWARHLPPFTENTEELEALTLSMIACATGYKILDMYFDETVDERVLPASEAKQLCVAQHLIATHELRLAQSAAGDPQSMDTIRRCNRLYNNFGIREQAAKWQHSPIHEDEYLMLGHKSAPIFSYFVIGLTRTNRHKELPRYEELFFLLTASLQITDDIADAERDLAHGNITLFTAPFVQQLSDKTVLKNPDLLRKTWQEASKIRKAQRQHLLQLVSDSYDKAQSIAQSLDDNVFELLILLRKIHTMSLIQ